MRSIPSWNVESISWYGENAAPSRGVTPVDEARLPLVTGQECGLLPRPEGDGSELGRFVWPGAADGRFVCPGGTVGRTVAPGGVDGRTV
jgi:hypothetical protein